MLWAPEGNSQQKTESEEERYFLCAHNPYAKYRSAVCTLCTELALSTVRVSYIPVIVSPFMLFFLVSTRDFTENRRPEDARYHTTVISNQIYNVKALPSSSLDLPQIPRPAACDQLGKTVPHKVLLKEVKTQALFCV